MIDSWGISYEIAQRQISVEPTDDRSTLVRVIACCHQQQAVIRANVNTDLCHHMASLGHTVLKLKIILEDHFIILCINHWLSWYTEYKQPLSHAIECGRFWSQIMDCGRKKILDALGKMPTYHDDVIETVSALLDICAGNSSVSGEFPAQRPVTRGFDVFFDLRPDKQLSKQSWGWWFETPSHSLWRHRNVK